MTAYLLLVLMNLISATSVGLTKKFQLSARTETENYLQANICAGVVSCVLLFLFNGCRMSISETTLICSLVLGFLSTISVFITVYVYSKTSLTLALIVSSAGAIVVPLLFGVLFNNETASIRLVVSAFLILFAAVFPFVKKDTFKDGKKFLWILILFFIFNGTISIVSKLYAQSETATDTASYLILTNVFVVVFSLLCALLILAKKKKNFVWINLSDASNSGLRTVLSVAASYLSVTILATMPVSLYSVLTSSISLILNALSSRFVFGEKMSLASKISLVLALASIIVAG